MVLLFTEYLKMEILLKEFWHFLTIEPFKENLIRLMNYVLFMEGLFILLVKKLKAMWIQW